MPETLGKRKGQGKGQNRGKARSSMRDDRGRAELRERATASEKQHEKPRKREYDSQTPAYPPRPSSKLPSTSTCPRICPEPQFQFPPPRQTHKRHPEAFSFLFFPSIFLDRI